MATTTAQILNDSSVPGGTGQNALNALNPFASISALRNNALTSIAGTVQVAGSQGGQFYYNAADTATGWTGTLTISGTTLTIVSTTSGAMAKNLFLNSGSGAWVVSGSGATWTLSSAPGNVGVATAATADNGITTYVDTAGRRFNRIYSGAINVLWAGYDPTGVSDGGYAINAAISNYTNVFIPPGTGITSQSLTIPFGTQITGVGGFQNTPSSRQSQITYNPAAGGWLFSWAAPGPGSQFEGDFLFDGLKFQTGALSSDAAGIIQIGDYNANFSTQQIIGRTIIQRCYIQGPQTNTGRGVAIQKVFDAQIEKNRILGWNYGVFGVGCDIARFTGNRFDANGTHVRWNVNGSFSGSLCLEHNEYLTSTYAAIHLSGAIAPTVRGGYIENVGVAEGGTAQVVTQTGTIAQSDLSTTLIGSGTTFTTQLGGANVGGDPTRVLIRTQINGVWEYRQVLSVTSDTAATLDAPFPTGFSGQAWGICYGVGIIASSCSELNIDRIRIDVTADSGPDVPRAYFSNCTGKAAIVSGNNANNGPIVVVSASPGIAFVVEDMTLSVGAPVSSAYPADYNFDALLDGSPNRTRWSDLTAALYLRPSMLFDYRNWFPQNGAGQFYKDATNTTSRPVVYLFTNGVGGNVSSGVAASMWGRRVRIRARIRAIGADSFVQFYAASALGATTTLIAALTVPVASGWVDVDLFTASRTVFSSSAKFFTVTKNTQSVLIEFIAITAMANGDPIYASGSPATVYTGAVGDTYYRSDGAAGSTFYLCTTAGTTWTAVA